jgi:hypothetical protein
VRVGGRIENKKMVSALKRYIFLTIFSAANLASDSDAASSGVTTLDIVLPGMNMPDRRIGVIAARQYPGLRS